MLDLAVAIAAILALIGLVAIVVRKFPTLAKIDTTSIPTEQQGALKARLMEQRLQRKMSNLRGNLGKILLPLGRRMWSGLRGLYDRLLSLEQRYRAKALNAPDLSPADQVKKEVHVETVIAAAEAALGRGELSEAEQHAIEVIAVDARNVEAYRILAQVYIGQKDYEHARETLNFLVDSLHVEDDELYAELGQVASQEGKFDEAKRDLEKSISLDAKVAGHYLDLCRVDLALGDSRAAFDHCRQAVELEPNNPKFLDALVDASIIAGKRDWAEETLKKLENVNPDNQKLTEFAGRIKALSQAKRRKSV